MAIKTTNHFCRKLASLTKRLLWLYHDAYDFGVNDESLDGISFAISELEDALLNCVGGHDYVTKKDETEEG